MEIIHGMLMIAWLWLLLQTCTQLHTTKNNQSDLITTQSFRSSLVAGVTTLIEDSVQYVEKTISLETIGLWDYLVHGWSMSNLIMYEREEQPLRSTYLPTSYTIYDLLSTETLSQIANPVVRGTISINTVANMHHLLAQYTSEPIVAQWQDEVIKQLTTFDISNYYSYNHDRALSALSFLWKFSIQET